MFNVVILSQFNPCELVFNKVKGYLKLNSQLEEETFLSAIVAGFATVSPTDMIGMFTRCLDFSSKTLSSTRMENTSH